MAIVFDNLVIDRPLWGLFRNSENEILGGLNQIQNLSISNTSETKDKTDARGILIKRFFTSKAVEVSAENALFSLSLMGLQTGNGKQIGSATNKITLPMIVQASRPATANATFNIELPAGVTPIEGTISVYGLNADNTPDLTRQFVLDEQPGSGKFTLSTVDGEGGSVTTIGIYNASADPAPARVQVAFHYETANGVKVLQSGDKFPKECEFILAVLVSDACDKEKVRLAYIDFPAFQMSPDFDITMDTDSPHPFSGTAALDYCSEDQGMYYVAISEDDEYEG